MDELERERIRRAYYVDGRSIRQLAQEEGLHRSTIRKALSNDGIPYKPPLPPKQRPVFGPYQERVEKLLQERLPRKQRDTSHRIFEIIVSEGYQGSEATVRQ